MVACISVGSAHLQHCEASFTAVICSDMLSFRCWLSERVGNMVSPDIGLADVLPLGSIRQVAGVVNRDLLSICHHASVHHSGRGDDQIQVVLTLQPFLYNLHVQQTQEATAEAESHCAGHLHDQKSPGRLPWYFMRQEIATYISMPILDTDCVLVIAERHLLCDHYYFMLNTHSFAAGGVF